MAKNRKKHSSQIKFNAVVDSIKKDNVTETAREYQIHPNLLNSWKRDFFDKGYNLFENNKDNIEKALKKRLDQYEKLLGKKELEINLLKGFVDFYAPLDTK